MMIRRLGFALFALFAWVSLASGANGPLLLGDGGTGCSNSACARGALNAAQSNINADITQLNAVQSINAGFNNAATISGDYAGIVFSNNPGVNVLSFYTAVNPPALFADNIRVYVEGGSTSAVTSQQGIGCYSTLKQAHATTPPHNVVCYFALGLAGADGSLIWGINTAWADRSDPSHIYAAIGVAFEADMTTYNALSTANFLSMLLNGPVQPASAVGLNIGTVPGAVAQYTAGVLVAQGVINQGGFAIGIGSQLYDSALVSGTGDASNFIGFSIHDTALSKHALNLQAVVSGTNSGFIIKDATTGGGLILSIAAGNLTLSPLSPNSAANIILSGKSTGTVQVATTLQLNGLSSTSSILTTDGSNRVTQVAAFANASTPASFVANRIMDFTVGGVLLHVPAATVVW